MDEEKRDQNESQDGIVPGPPPEVQEPAPPRLKTSRLAIASLVSAVTCVGAPVGLILGIAAIMQIDRNRDRFSGMGLAVAGAVVGGFATLVLLPITAAIFFPVFARARATAIQSSCMGNVKQLSAATMLYIADYDGQYPPVSQWNEAMSVYVKNPDVFNCPAAKGDLPSYAINGHLNGLREDDVIMHAKTVLLYDSMPGRNQSGDSALMPVKARHYGSHVVSFTDGHVMAVGEDDVNSLKWDPLAVAAPSLPTGDSLDMEEPCTDG